MSGRIFQNIVLQFKETTDTVIGVIDSEGTVIACTDLPEIGQRWPHLVQPINASEGDSVALEGKTFKALEGWGGQFDFAAFTCGEDALSATVCRMATVALNTAKSYYEEKHDKGSFIKNVVLDNILPSDIYIKSKELHFNAEECRVVFLIKFFGKTDMMPYEMVQNMFPDRTRDYVISVSEHDVVLVKEVKQGTETAEMEKVAVNIADTLSSEFYTKASIGVSTVVENIKDLGRAYKEAQIALDVGKVFETDKNVISYENLGIGRLIYQLPTTLCEMFLQEVFKKGSLESLDRETLMTIQCFFENNLNVSETSRKLFVHRNTLVYRLEKIKKLTGLDLREFDDAITFKVALMVKKYLASRGIEA